MVAEPATMQTESGVTMAADSAYRHRIVSNNPLIMKANATA